MRIIMGKKKRNNFNIILSDIPLLKLAQVFLGRSRMMLEIVSMAGPTKKAGRR
jgi:hypothetical protein